MSAFKWMKVFVIRDRDEGKKCTRSSDNGDSSDFMSFQYQLFNIDSVMSMCINLAKWNKRWAKIQLLEDPLEKARKPAQQDKINTSI